MAYKWHFSLADQSQIIESSQKSDADFYSDMGLLTRIICGVNY